MTRKLLIITCLISTVFVAFGQKKKKNKDGETVKVEDTSAKINYKLVGAPMPPMRLVTQKGKVITHNDVKNDANLFIMMFNPTCEHCQDETILLGKNIDLFRKSHILLMATSNMLEYLDFFNTATGVKSYPSIVVGLDSAQFIDKAYNYIALPQINIYGKDRKLIRVFSGDTPIDSLKPYIE